MNAFEPECRRIADALVAELPRGEDFDLMTAFAQPFALRIQCAFMGWPASLHEPLRQWIGRNHAATRAGDRTAMAQIAVEFDGHIKQQLVVRRDAGEQAPDDVTSRLLHESINGRPLSDEEIVSIVRNWTVGELGTIAASVGIVVQYLAAHPALQAELRQQADALADAIDEILRIHAPLIANRRVTTCPVEIGGRRLEAGERLTLIWASANRDEAVFGDPDAFDPVRNRDNNLLYGAGVHVCPGAAGKAGAAPDHRRAAREYHRHLACLEPVASTGQLPGQRLFVPASASGVRALARGGWCRHGWRNRARIGTQGELPAPLATRRATSG